MGQYRISGARASVRVALLTSTFLGSAAAALLPASQAQAACTPIASAGPPVQPPPGTTVTCSGTTANQNSPNGYGATSFTGFGNQVQNDGLTINVLSGASVTGDTAIGSGFVLQNNNTVNNSGAIAGGTGIFAGSLVVTNTSVGTITGAPTGTGVAVSIVNLTNAGSITGGTGVQTSGGPTTIVNSGTIATNATATQGIGFGLIVQSSPGGPFTLTNSGTIAGANLPTVPNPEFPPANTPSAGILFFGPGIQVNRDQFRDHLRDLRHYQSRGAFGASAPVGIVNSGTITGSGGTAISFVGSGNTLTLQPGSVINGNVLSTGSNNNNNTFQLGGAGTATFDVSSIGPSAQYRNFSTFNKIDIGGWTLTGSGAQNWTASSGQLIGDTNSIQGNVINNGAGLIFNQNFNGTYAGVLSGTGGGFTKSGTGTLTLTGANTYTPGPGGILVGGGTLQAGAAGTFPSTAAFFLGSDQTNNLFGKLDLNNFNQTIGSLSGGTNNPVTLGTATLTTGGDNTSTSYSGVISGSGGLVKAGTGTFSLSGANTYTGGTTISAGTLRLLTGGSIVGNVADNGILAINHSDAFTFGGVISGTGAVNQNGAGTTTLTGASTYTGLTNVNAGILNVTGSLASSAMVNSGGTLGGSGTVGGFTAASGGMIAPGNAVPFSTLNVKGNVTFAAGSTYQVNANAAGQADKIAATGTATLSGGTVQVLAANATYNASTNYTILTATGGVTGTFANSTSNLAFLSAMLSYTSNSVVLTLNRNSTTFANVAQTFNQRAVGGALDASPFGSALVQAALPLSSPQALGAFDALAGEIHGTVQSSLMEDSRFMRQAVLGRLRAASYSGDGSAMAALTAGGPLAFQANGAPANGADTLPAELMAYGKSPMPVKAPPLAPRGPDITYWGQGFGAWGHWDGDGNAARMDRDLAGVIAGADMRLADNWRAGLAAGYMHSDISVDARASSANVDTFHVAGYLGGRFGAFNLRSGAAYAWHDIDTTRSILFPGFADLAHASYNGSTAQVFGEAGYGFAFGNVAVEPFAGLAWVRVGTDGFNETGGPAALRGVSGSTEVGYSSVGLRTATSVPLSNGMVLIPRASAAWQHAFNDVTPTTALAFQSTGIGFITAGVPIAQDSALVEAGFDLAVTANATFGVFYSGQLAEHAADHGAKGKFTWKF